MKFHWGIGIAIVYGVFMLLMVGFVICSRNVDHSLVMDNYYEEDLTYQAHMDKVANAGALTQDLKILEDDGSGKVTFEFPQDLADIGGEIWFYRPSDTSKDLKVEIVADRLNMMTVPTQDLLDGRWRVKVEWHGSGKAFYKEQELYIQ